MDYLVFVAAKTAFVGIVLLLPMALLPLPWWQVGLAYAIASMAMSLLFVFTLIGTHFAESSSFPVVQPDGSIDGSFVDNTFATSLDWNPTGFWATHLIGGLNAHIAHHLFPKVSHMHYRAISRIVARLAERYGIVYHRTNLRGMIAAHFRLLHRLGQPPLASVASPV
jgi:linoleoyl-CoA desaturase